MTGVESQSAIELRTFYSAFAFGLAMVRPQLQLDGGEPAHLPAWGTITLPVRPGPHRLRCWFRWGVFAEGGNSTFDVDAPAGAVVRVSYKAPSGFVFTKGKWAHEGTAPLSAPAPGWHPDPTGRSSLRYWDGSAWTANVSTNGATSVDPMG